MIRREDGECRGGARVTLSLGTSWRVVGAPLFLAPGHRLNSSEYPDALGNTYAISGSNSEGILLSDGFPNTPTIRVKAHQKI